MVTSNPSVSVRLKSSLSSFVETPTYYLIINFSGKKLQGSELAYETDSLDHDPIFKISHIEGTASSTLLEDAEHEECPLNTLVHE